MLGWIGLRITCAGLQMPDACWIPSESTDRLGHETNHSDLQNKCNKHISIELRTDKLTPFDDAASLSECVMLCSSVFEAKRQQCNYLKSICCTCNKSQYVTHTLVSIFSTSLKNIHWDYVLRSEWQIFSRCRLFNGFGFNSFVSNQSDHIDGRFSACSL